MSSSQWTKTPQPRGLPGFLRRTFRNSHDQDITLDSPSSSPGTPVLPDDPYITRSGSAVVGDNIIISGSSNEGDSVTSEDDGGRSKSEGSHVGSNADSNRIPKSPGSANNEKDTNNRSDRSAKPANASYARGPSIGSKKHLRAVAFPPLPHEQDGDDSDDSDDYSGGSENSSQKVNTSAAKATQPLPNNSSSSSNDDDDDDEDDEDDDEEDEEEEGGDDDDDDDDDDVTEKGSGLHPPPQFVGRVDMPGSTTSTRNGNLKRPV
mmetsp:Transcript_29599/g.54330  ORF Transcript_29599/g.54330 Transcript_29599/m.54330 type:complete len:263 (-) Transcript_29599:155-943(-)